MGLLDGKSAVITGAGLGIAKAATKVFAREGANVEVVDAVLQSKPRIQGYHGKIRN